MRDFWSDLFGANPEGIFIIIDPMVGQEGGRLERAQLRALPLFLELGVRNFTFVDTWSQYKLIDFNYKKYGIDSFDTEVFPLCQFISQDIEFHSEFEVTKHLLNLSHATEGSTLVLVLDSVKFCLKDNQDGKPMIEDWGLSEFTFEYERLFPRYLKLIEIDDPPLPLTETLNLVFHQMAKLHIDVLGIKPKRLADLFEYDVIPSESYAWEILKSFANKKTQMEFHPYIHQCLRPWIEKDVTRIADQMLEALQRCQFDPRKVERLRSDRKRKERK